MQFSASWAQFYFIFKLVLFINKYAPKATISDKITENRSLDMIQSIVGLTNVIKSKDLNIFILSLDILFLKRINEK